MWIQKVRGGVTDVAFSLDGHSLYTLDTSGRITVWDLQSHTPLRIDSEHLFRHRFVRGFHPLNDGRVLIRSDKFTFLDTQGNLTTQPGPPELGNGFAQVRNDGRVYFVSDMGRSIVAWEVGSPISEPAFTLPANHSTGIDKFDWSRDGRSLVTRCRDGTVNLFESTADGRSHDLVPVKGVPHAYRVKFSPDGSTLVVFSSTPDRFTLWDVPSRTVRVAGVQCSTPWGLFAFNPVYPLFATGQKDGVLAVWRLEDGRPVQSLDFALGRSVRCVAFSPDGLTCAVGGTNKQFAVFDVDV